MIVGKTEEVLNDIQLGISQEDLGLCCSHSIFNPFWFKVSLFRIHKDIFAFPLFCERANPYISFPASLS